MMHVQGANPMGTRNAIACTKHQSYGTKCIYKLKGQPCMNGN